MSQSGSFGVNYKKTFLSTDVALPAAVLARGNNKFGEFLFCLAGGAIAQYAAVGVTSAGSATELTTTTYAASMAVGFAQVAVASGEYFWLWIGNGGGTNSGIKGKVAASYAAYGVIHTTATAGVVDDAATKVLGGVVGLTTDGGSGSSVELFAVTVIHKVTL